MNSDNLRDAAQALHAVADSLMKAAESMEVLESRCNYFEHEINKEIDFKKQLMSLLESRL
jgi:hypothetical protein